MKSSRSRSALALIFTISCLCLVPQAAAAGTLTIYPASLTAGGDPDAAVQPDYVTASPQGADFWAYVKLPNGATLTKLEYRGMGNGLPGSIVSLMRHRPGLDNSEVVGAAVSQDAGAWTTFFTTTFNFAKVNNAYKHFIRVQLGPDNRVGFIKIAYKQ